MPSLKQILSHEDERLNLKNAGICVALVLLLVLVVFGFKNLNFLFSTSPNEPASPPATEAPADP